jgi:short-subunit dehydrogenase
MRDPRSILITGASSGIGEALALAYARPGVFLALSGRNAERLAAVATAVKARGAAVETAALDVVDRAALGSWIKSIDATHPLDLVVANAGISPGTSGTADAAEQTRRIFAINLDGVINTVEAALPPMQARGRGQIALMASLAALLGAAQAPAYCASKAAVRIWGEGLRALLAPAGIAVSVIMPGFVESRMTASNPRPKPGMISAARAAEIIVRKLAANRARIAFPPWFYWLVRAAASLPADTLAWVTRKAAQE